jgi:hypothetical protein
VGVGFFRDASSGNQLYVNYAKLSLTAPDALLGSEGIVIDDANDTGGAGGSDEILP